MSIDIDIDIEMVAGCRSLHYTFVKTKANHQSKYLFSSFLHGTNQQQFRLDMTMSRKEDEQLGCILYCTSRGNSSQVVNVQV